MLTIHHKHKHKKNHYHHHRQNDHLTTTTSFDTPSAHTSIPIKESVQKYKHLSTDVSSVITDQSSARNVNFNSTDIEQIKSTYQLNDKQMLYSKLFPSSNSTTEHSEETDSSTHQLTPHKIPLSSNDLIESNKKATRIHHYPNMLADLN